MVHFVEFEELKYVHMLMSHTFDSYLRRQYAFAFRSKKAVSEIAHLLKMMAVLEMHLQNKADDAMTCVSIKIQSCF